MKRLMSVVIVLSLAMPILVGCQKKEEKPAPKESEKAIAESVVIEQQKAVPESLQEVVPETLGS